MFSLNSLNSLNTRMHSSRMHTVRCSSRLPGGVCPGGCLPGGVYPGGVCSGGVWPGGACPVRCTPTLWTEFLTHACENITFKNICHYSKGFKPANSCVRHQDATTAPLRHMWETRSLHFPQFMLQWFIRSPEYAEFIEFLFHLGKTPFYFFQNEEIFI